MNRASAASEPASSMAAFGYDPEFLAVNLPLPQAAIERDSVELDYTHFTVLLDRSRRLAAATAVNIDGGNLVDARRGDDWHLGPRVPAEVHAGPELIATMIYLDGGHLVRRRDPVWGTPAVAAEANNDTFAYTNAAPQAAGFNQSKELWLGLEDYVLEHARVFDLRLTVFTGPIFNANDRRYRGIQIPLAYWKVAAWVDEDGVLAATGYVVDQRPELDDLDLEQALLRAAVDQTVPPLGTFQTFQVPILDSEKLTQLNFGPAALADRFSFREIAPTSHPRWVRIEHLSAIVM